jgi:HEAT repeat protein
MRKMTMTLGLITLWAGLAVAGQAQERAEAASGLSSAWSAAPAAETVPAGLQQDPADSLYRAGRRALNAGDYREAADYFATIRARHPNSGYVADAYYWEAYARYRGGNTQDLRVARELLKQQAEQYPNAATGHDAEILLGRVQGTLARHGDAEAAEGVAIAAAPAAPARPERPERPERAEPPPRPPRPKGHEDDVRVTALNALLQMNAEQAVPILRKVLEQRGEGSVELRRKAVFILSQKPTDETAAIMLDVVRNDPDAEVRAQAVFWLSQVPTEEAVIALDSVLLHSTDREVQEKAVFALSQHGSDRAAQALRNYVEREDVPEELKEKAIFWIGQHHDHENREFLRQLYGRLRSAELRERVIFAISQGGMEADSRWLMDRALDTEESLEMRKKALFWAGQSHEVSTADLVRLYDTIGDYEMRKQLVFVFSQRHEPEVIEKMMDIARNDPDPDLRKQAVFWLGQSDDPRVADFLLELITQEVP